uniref:Transposase n=1 Tax=bacterium enrichment culture clone fosmid MGS-K1 TaxID=1549356 RepID=A0A0B5KHB3_9BACT|nr:hypothetical protein [bacterium enrichment culture clone fosmid MGS-K1]
MMYHMAMNKVGVSIAGMQRLLDIPHYRTAWLMAHKIRKAMSDRDARYSLAGLVEMDDAFFGPKGTKRGRGSERKSTVLCAVSLYRDRRGEERPGFAHMQVVDNASADTIEGFWKGLDTELRPKKSRSFWKRFVPMDGGPTAEQQRGRICLITKLSFGIQKLQEGFSRGFIGPSPMPKP